MKLEIKNKKENKLLGRTEVEGTLTFEGATPSNEVVRDSLAAELSADKNLMVIKKIHSRFSTQEADFLAFVYDTAEAMGKIEMSTKHLKKQAAEKKKKAAEEEIKIAGEEKPVEKEAPAKEKPAEESAAEEEKKEEAPVEEAKEEGE